MLKIRVLAIVFALLSGTAFADEISISDFNWYGNDGFCHFRLPDQVFNFDAPETWRYVFITNLPAVNFDDPPETPEEIADAALRSYAPAFMVIDHGLHELGFKSGFSKEGHLQIVYTTYGDRPYEVVLNAKEGEEGYESQAFSGTITVRRDGAVSAISFEGDCGV